MTVMITLIHFIITLPVFKRDWHRRRLPKSNVLVKYGLQHILQNSWHDEQQHLLAVIEHHLNPRTAKCVHKSLTNSNIWIKSSYLWLVIHLICWRIWNHCVRCEVWKPTTVWIMMCKILKLLESHCLPDMINNFLTDVTSNIPS